MALFKQFQYYNEEPTTTTNSNKQQTTTNNNNKLSTTTLELEMTLKGNAPYTLVVINRMLFFSGVLGALMYL
eukprot:56213-Amphidinium_carterae.1